MAKNTKSKNGVKNDNYSSAYEMDRTGNTYEEENKSKNGYKQDGNIPRLPQKQGRGHLGDRQEILRDKGTPARCVMLAPGVSFPVYLWLLH